MEKNTGFWDFERPKKVYREFTTNNCGNESKNTAIHCVGVAIIRIATVLIVRKEQTSDTATQTFQKTTLFCRTYDAIGV